ncbi:TadE/TadG family type IV pilus assembly protein [Stakelama saccharophila]|uniref:TadE/TadG family type IV pilus assembly protein n=1 Tax=Stakelama saccharophila TaxID=3075605 RepID=A0ABZ0BBE7_9SPHN|nr:TadE/TadG family type IV pilus assembly protein [Stakelama sp. W311]WNO54757.1 TadE/TadG family type IV pilus assembly protein [Stakelama sp. W311]
MRTIPSAALLRADIRATALVEFAIVLPILLCLLAGIVGYGRYLLIAHDAQQIANDAARATIAGLNTPERRSLAAAVVARGVRELGLSADRVSQTVADDAGRVTVTVRIDTGGDALLSTDLIPLPGRIVERRAVVAPGGIR